jgi:tetratricopeptide (TPR) repeat protein
MDSSGHLEEGTTVNLIRRPSASVIALVALSIASTPMLAQTPRQPEQRGGVPNSDTPYIVVATFRSPDRALGLTMADELRKRLQSEKSTKELYVVPARSIKAMLEAAGFPFDSALSASEVSELARSLRSDEILDGLVTKTANGVHVEPRLLLRTGQRTVAQPLPAVDAKDLGDAAKQIERALTEASKAIPSYRLCTTALRASQFDDAAKAARTGLTMYGTSMFARLCLLSAFSAQKASPDSIIPIAKTILAADPTSLIALSNLADAYAQKSDTANAVETNVSIYDLDHSNLEVGRAVVQEILKLRRPERAIRIVDEMLVQNPGDPDLLQQRWIILVNAGHRKDAIKAGEEWVKVDTSKATLEYYERQIGIAQQDSDAATTLQLAKQGATKFPANAELQLLVAQGERKAGQFQAALTAAHRAAEIDPKNVRTTMLVMYIQNDLNHPDSAMATAQRAIASGQNKDTIGQALLGNVVAAIRQAQTTSTRGNWEAALKAAQSVDAIAPSPPSKYYSGVAAFSVAIDALTNVQTLQLSANADDRAKACAELKVVEDDFTVASIVMPAGGRVDPAAAKQVLDGISTYSPYLPRLKTQLRCK